MLLYWCFWKISYAIFNFVASQYDFSTIAQILQSMWTNQNQNSSLHLLFLTKSEIFHKNSQPHRHYHACKFHEFLASDMVSVHMSFANLSSHVLMLPENILQFIHGYLLPLSANDKYFELTTPPYQPILPLI